MYIQSCRRPPHITPKRMGRRKDRIGGSWFIFLTFYTSTRAAGMHLFNRWPTCIVPKYTAPGIRPVLSHSDKGAPSPASISFTSANPVDAISMIPGRFLKKRLVERLRKMKVKTNSPLRCCMSRRRIILVHSFKLIQKAFQTTTSLLMSFSGTAWRRTNAGK